MPDHSTLKELLDRRNEAKAKCRSIVDRAEKDADGNPILSAEAQQEFDRYEAEFKSYHAAYQDRLKAKQRMEWLAETDEDQPVGGRITDPDDHAGSVSASGGVRRIQWNPAKCRHTNRVLTLAGPRASAEYAVAFNRVLAGLDPDTAFRNFQAGEYRPHNAGLQSDVEEKGGYFIASEEFVAGILKNVDDATFVQRLGRLFVVRNARSLGVRKRTQKVNTFTWGQELTDVSGHLDASLKYGQRRLTPHYITGGIALSRDLLRSAMLPIETMVQEELAIDLGEKLEDAYLYGDGNEKPLGVLTASSEGISTARDVASTDADVNTNAGEDGTTHWGFNTLIRAKYNQKLQYRNRSRWMFHRDAMARIAMIKDLNGQYIWQPSKIVGEPDTILGLPADESEWMPNTFTAGNYFGLLADWSYYWIAVGLEVEMLRLNEIRARTNEVEYICRMKVDAMPILEEAFTRLKLAAS